MDLRLLHIWVQCIFVTTVTAWTRVSPVSTCRADSSAKKHSSIIVKSAWVSSHLVLAGGEVDSNTRCHGFGVSKEGVKAEGVLLQVFSLDVAKVWLWWQRAGDCLLNRTSEQVDGVLTRHLTVETCSEWWLISLVWTYRHWTPDSSEDKQASEHPQ